MTPNPAHHMNLGQSAFDRGDHGTAEAHFRDALADGESGFDLMSFLGFLTRKRDANDEAGDWYAAALDLEPGDAPTANNLADVRRVQGRTAEAIALFRRAAELAPDKAEIHANLGGLLLAKQRPDLAIPCLEQALAANPRLTAAHADMGTALSAMNRYAEVPAHYRAIHEQEPANNSARYMEALALLANGDFTNGWRKHESRWYAELGLGHRAQIAFTPWLGEPDIAGRTILLHAEQGLGDTCQFVRYVPMVAALGARVWLMAPDPLLPLFRGMAGVERFFAYGETMPAFDTHCSLMSLPRAFRTEIATVPAATPYLHAPADRVARWAERVGERDGRRRVGIAWSGSDSVWNRSIGLERMAPLLQRDDCAFHVVQTHIHDADREIMARMPDLVDHSADLADFADTAALLSQMDQVISVDTVLVHLAGAMALKTWTLLPLGADYRWMTQGETSPWYPTMRLFRQPRFDDWESVVAAVTRALDTELPHLRFAQPNRGSAIAPALDTELR